ncbi:MAG: UDP-3-O-(3-hydroxymyristoyl)glucosamine N-acyltransferase [Proteobacteria bacterium]|nr:UDP-3-O-(3-hydroxymyristoyl)glucosamine N-acyltransferase [Pseudomonadota bacterium]
MNHHFLKTPKSLSVEAIAKQIGATIIGDSSVVINDIASLSSANAGDLTFLHNSKYLSSAETTLASAIIVEEKYAHKVNHSCVRLVVESPYRAFGKAALLFYPKETSKNTISPLASINEDVTLGENITIEAFVVIKKGAKIGNNSIIKAHTVIGENVVIGNNTTIEPHVTLDYCFIGDNVYIKPGARIGQPGFGFHMDEKGHFDIPQLGCVIIEDDVHLGANTTVDRGSQSNTIIKKGTRIDNLVQIAHNVEVGEKCVLAAQVGIAGSTKLGRFVIAGGQVGIIGHLNIGDYSKLSVRSLITRSIRENDTVAGYPAVPIQDFHRQTIALKNLIQKKGA